MAANRDATLSDIAERLETESVGSVVLAEHDSPVGLVTDRDVALALTDGEDVARLRRTAADRAEQLLNSNPK